MRTESPAQLVVPLTPPHSLSLRNLLRCCEFVRSRLRGPDTSLTEVCEALLRHCHDLGSTDNMSVIVGTVL